MSIERVLEPELMDDPDEATSYDAMDHSHVNRQFVIDLLSHGPIGSRVLDLGTGTAQIPIELCRQMALTDTAHGLRIVASDAAPSMLDVARANIAAAGVETQIELHLGDSKELDFPENAFECVMSNSLIHHLADPLAALREMSRVTKKSGRIFVRDLMRPDSAEQIESLVREYASSETPQNQQLLRQSLFAALTLEEIRAMVSEIGFPPESVVASSDRHWTFCGLR